MSLDEIAKDEIASNLYLSRCDKVHDLCTEYYHALYDTIDFVLYQTDVPEIDLLSEVSPYLTNRRDCICLLYTSDAADE